MGKTGDKPYETSLPAVEKFVKSSAKRIRYNVAVDNNAQDMVNLWLKPAGILGIPTTFIVKQGKIVWIGHPIELDTLMDPILNGTYDFAAFKKRYEDRKSASSKANSEMNEFFDAVKLAENAKDYNKALQLLDEGSQKTGTIGLISKLRKFSLLLEHFTEAEAMKYGKEVIKENPGFATAAAHTIVEKDNLSKETYLFAAETFKTALETNKYSAMYDNMALCYFKAGDISLAIEAEKKAVELAKLEVKDPKFEGYVFEDTIAGYEETSKSIKRH
ncbi:MAG: hypothetical protein IPK31_13810 [Chitinophagaceae bacterium]|nr:hypothetical protein [Chitinophagaceae bacterium]